MGKSDQQSKFQKKWEEAARHMYRTWFGIPLPRILFHVVSRADEQRQSQGDEFDLETALISWMTGWMNATIEVMSNRSKEHEQWERQWDKRMRTPQEVEKLKETLQQVNDFPSNEEWVRFYDHVRDDKNYVSILNVSDALSWVLGEISTDHFLSPNYLDVERLRKIREDFIDD